MSHGNLTRPLPPELREELFTQLVRADAVRIERIVSRGHASPAGFWYDQDEHEFVLLVAGRARLELADRGELELTPGDWLEIPAHLRHRVSWTDPTTDTIWLAVFYAERHSAADSS